MKTRSNAYWDKRSLQRMAEYHRSADSTVRTINRAYDQSVADINEEIEKIFRTFGANGQLDPAEAKRILNQRIPNPLLKLAKKIYPGIRDKKTRRWLLTRMNAPAYRARITRLEALRESVRIQSKVIADVELTTSNAFYMKTIREAYFRTMFDIQRGLGVGFEFATIPNRVIETILKNPWSGKHFSSRIWGNTDELADQLSKTITSGFESGIGMRKMIHDLMEVTATGKFAASRLIRTETTFMANMAEMESYAEAEIDEYLFMATLDRVTSEICQEQDRKIYRVKDAKPGVNMPPMHPFCRSTTRAYFGPETIQNIQRRSRNPVTGKNELVPANMNYPDWLEKYAA